MKTKLLKTERLPTCLPHTIFDAKDIFTGWIDSDFKNYGLTSDSSSEEKEIEVHELTENGTFKQIYDSLGRSLDSMVMTQGQIIEFAKKMEKSDPYSYFFLLKKGSEFFVARVRVFSDGLRVFVGRLEDGYVWFAEYQHRIVVPQLALGTLEPSPSVTLTQKTVLQTFAGFMAKNPRTEKYEVLESEKVLVIKLLD